MYIFRFIADTLFHPHITPTGPYSLRTSFATTQPKTKTSTNLDPDRDPEEGLDLTMGVGLMGHRLLPISHPQTTTRKYATTTTMTDTTIDSGTGSMVSR
jgi:hypothetical protein